MAAMKFQRDEVLLRHPNDFSVWCWLKLVLKTFSYKSKCLAISLTI